MIKKINLDMDGVLFNFTAQVAEDWGVDESKLTEWGLWNALEITEKTFWRWLHEQDETWWENLPIFPWAHELLAFCKTIAPVTFATAGAKSAASHSGKMKCLVKHFGDECYRTTMMGQEKEELAKTTSVLIDDADKNIDKFRAAGGMAITFPRPWNAESKYSDKAFAKCCYELGVLAQKSDETDKCCTATCDFMYDPSSEWLSPRKPVLTVEYR
jgi:5'(3')-deoxyribonucleotidase